MQAEIREIKNNHGCWWHRYAWVDGCIGCRKFEADLMWTGMEKTLWFLINDKSGISTDDPPRGGAAGRLEYETSTTAPQDGTSIETDQVDGNIPSTAEVYRQQPVELHHPRASRLVDLNLFDAHAEGMKNSNLFGWDALVGRVGEAAVVADPIDRSGGTKGNRAISDNDLGAWGAASMADPVMMNYDYQNHGPVYNDTMVTYDGNNTAALDPAPRYVAPMDTYYDPIATRDAASGAAMQYDHGIENEYAVPFENRQMYDAGPDTYSAMMMNTHRDESGPEDTGIQNTYADAVLAPSSTEAPALNPYDLNGECAPFMSTAWANTNTNTTQSTNWDIGAGGEADFDWDQELAKYI